MENHEKGSVSRDEASAAKAKKIDVVKKLKNKRFLSVVGILVVLGVIFSVKGTFIAASVNGSPISRLAVIHELEKNSGKIALEVLITQKLIDEEATKNNITVSREEIDDAIAQVEDQVASQGGTLEQLLTIQGITRDDFEKQVIVEKKLEKLLTDKITVTDEEITQYITDNKIAIPEGSEESYKKNIETQIRQQKLSTEAGSYIDTLRQGASIRYFVNY